MTIKTGVAAKMPSSLSKIPPCPGRMLPSFGEQIVLLTSQVRFLVNTNWHPI
jgi:hypothetical protein